MFPRLRSFVTTLVFRERFEDALDPPHMRRVQLAGIIAEKEPPQATVTDAPDRHWIILSRYATRLSSIFTQTAFSATHWLMLLMFLMPNHWMRFWLYAKPY